MARTTRKQASANIEAAMAGQREERNRRRREKRAAAKAAADATFEDPRFDEAAEARGASFEDEAEQARATVEANDADEPKPKRRATRSTPRSEVVVDPVTKSVAARPDKGLSKAQIVRDLLDAGKSILEASKESGIPYPYVWDIHRAWKAKQAK